MSQGKPLLRIVIVNWNSREQLRSCLRSIAVARTDGLGLERVVVVDNASADGSADGLEEEFVAWAASFPEVLLRPDE